MTEPFARPFHARWGDMDFNGHMRNTAYLDLAADLRMQYFQANGFSMREFERLGIGPVIFRDELLYFRELRLLQPGVATLAVAAMKEDGSRFSLRNDFFGEDKKPLATVTSDGGWLDLGKRRLTAPPQELVDILSRLARTADFSPGPSPTGGR